MFKTIWILLEILSGIVMIVAASLSLYSGSADLNDCALTAAGFLMLGVYLFMTKTEKLLKRFVRG